MKEKEKSAGSIHLLTEAKEALSNQFKTLANEKVGKQLEKAQESYTTAMSQLISGKGNLIT